MRQPTTGFIARRLVAVGTLVITSLLLASAANADVIANEHFAFTVTNTNPCAPQDGLVTLNFEEHRVTQELADGTLVIHSNFHGTGSSTSGVEYVVNRHQVTLVVGETGSAAFEVRRISKGPGDNVLIEATRTFPPLVDTITFRCVG
jgi:hypothetical protein